MLKGELTGSLLTRTLLEKSDTPVWCAVADSSDEEAMQDLTDNDFTALISSCDEYSFFSTSGIQWLCAVPIKIVRITET